MAETNDDRERRARVPAYALLRAAVLQDRDVAVHLAARAMLATEGYDTAKVLRIVDGWLETAAHGVPAPHGRPGATA